MRAHLPGTNQSRSAIGIVAGAGGLTLAAWHRLFRKPLPQVSGEITVSGIDQPVTIGRDRFGVPHIRARSREDLAFGQGFAVAPGPALAARVLPPRRGRPGQRVRRRGGPRGRPPDAHVRLPPLRRARGGGARRADPSAARGLRRRCQRGGRPGQGAPARDAAPAHRARAVDAGRLADDGQAARARLLDEHGDRAVPRRARRPRRRGEGDPARPAVPAGQPARHPAGHRRTRATRSGSPSSCSRSATRSASAPRLRAATTGSSRARARRPASRCSPATRTSPRRCRASGTPSSSRRPASSCAAPTWPASPAA